MNGEAASGGSAGADGSRTATVRLSILLVLTISMLQVTANATSALVDKAGTGIHTWEPWAWELTSLIAWMALWPAVWLAVSKIRPPRFQWPSTLAIHVAISVPVSMVHVAGMLLLRAAVYAVAGLPYHPGDLGDVALYEYRKDAATYVLFAAVFALIQWRLAASAPVSSASDPRLLAVRDGSVTHRIPIDEIDHVASAGNYVALRWKGRTVLHRSTLGAMEKELACGFVRIHRTCLVRQAAIRQIVTRQSGDFELILNTGEHLNGSRRFRSSVQEQG